MEYKTHTHTQFHLLCWIKWVRVCKEQLKRLAIWFMVTLLASDRQSLKLMAGLWLSPKPTVTYSMGWSPDYRRSQAVRDALELGQWLWRLVGWSFLPALTWAACRIKMNVTAAVSVESHSHLFVFHLVVHLCISMVSARSCTENGRLLIKFGPFHNRQKMSVYYSAMCESIGMPRTARLGPSDALPFKPSSQTDGKGLSWKTRKPLFPGSCAPSGGWTKALTLNLNRLSDTDTGKSFVHQITSRESCVGTRPCALEEVWAASAGASLKCNLITGLLQYPGQVTNPTLIALLKSFIFGVRIKI